MTCDYREFLGDVLLFRAVRDSERTPGEWADRWLGNIEKNASLTLDERRRLVLATKMAELIDDYKGFLLEEFESDLRRASLQDEDLISSPNT